MPVFIGGHRGCGCTDHAFYGAPNKPVENTLESFQQAFKQGAHFVEIDAVMAADGTIFCLHNVSPSDHFFGEDAPHKPLIELSYGAFKRARTGHSQTGNLCLLEDALNTLATLQTSAPFIVNIEIKGGQGTRQTHEDERFIPNVVQVVAQAALAPEDILFSSFALKNIMDMAKHLPQAKYGLLFQEQSQLRPIYGAQSQDLTEHLPFQETFVEQAQTAFQQAAPNAQLTYI